jgi:hypothetical protein
VGGVPSLGNQDPCRSHGGALRLARESYEPLGEGLRPLVSGSGANCRAPGCRFPVPSSAIGTARCGQRQGYNTTPAYGGNSVFSRLSMRPVHYGASCD